MTSHDIESAYTAIANAVNDVGDKNAQLFLATLCLSLISERTSAQGVGALIAQAARLSQT
jgi:hypothetical protein